MEALALGAVTELPESDEATGPSVLGVVPTKMPLEDLLTLPVVKSFVADDAVPIVLSVQTLHDLAQYFNIQPGFVSHCPAAAHPLHMYSL